MCNKLKIEPVPAIFQDEMFPVKNFLDNCRSFFVFASMENSQEFSVPTWR